MFDYIKKTIHQNHTNEQQDNSITFSVDDLGKIKTIISITNKAQHSSGDFAYLLYHLNEGGFTKIILDTLFEISSKYPEHALLVSEIITKWSEKLKNSPDYNAEENPIVAPSQFYTYLGK